MPLLLQIPGATGTSGIAGYEGWFPLLGMSWNARRNHAFATSGSYRSAGVASAPLFSEVTVTRFSDAMTAWLWKMCVQNESFTGKLHWLRTGANNAPEVYSEMTLDGARILRIADTSGGSDRPTEQLTLSYGKIELAYTKFLDALTGVRAVAEFVLRE